MQYTSATSLVASWEPGGSQQISKKTVEKVLQVIGEESESTNELIDGFGNLKEGVIRNE